MPIEKSEVSSDALSLRARALAEFVDTLSPEQYELLKAYLSHVQQQQTPQRDTDFLVEDFQKFEPAPEPFH